LNSKLVEWRHGSDPSDGQDQLTHFGVSFNQISTSQMLSRVFAEVRRGCPSQSMPEPTLESWASQGVFLMNTTLTVTHGQFNSHANIGWKKAVTIPALEKLSAERDHLVFMLWGVHAKKFDHALDQRRHLVLKAAHPSPRSGGGFRGCGHFGKANKYLSRHGIGEIAW
jgi:uracil-DNA glycosylase